MIRVQSEQAEFLVSRLQGSAVKVVMSDEELKSVTLRLTPSLIAKLEAICNKTEWSRNVVGTILLNTGLEMVNYMIEQDQDQPMLMGKV